MRRAIIMVVSLILAGAIAPSPAFAQGNKTGLRELWKQFPLEETGTAAQPSPVKPSYEAPSYVEPQPASAEPAATDPGTGSAATDDRRAFATPVTLIALLTAALAAALLAPRLRYEVRRRRRRRRPSYRM